MGKRKKQNMAEILCFLLLIFGITVWTLVTPSREFSERENRVLAQMPDLTAETYFSGTFAEDYETYLSDQFPLRDRWIGVKTAAERATGKQESNDVYFAKDDYLIEAHTGTFQTDRAEQNLLFLQEFLERCTREYTAEHVTAMLVPNAVDILADWLPAYAAPYDEEEYLAKVQDVIPDGVWFDSGEVLREHLDVQLYYRTDHHWTTQAAGFVYEAWAKEQGVSPLSLDDYEAEVVSTDFRGTIDAKVGGENRADTLTIYRPKEEISYRVHYASDGHVTEDLYEYDALATRDQYSIYFGGNQGLVEIEVDNDSERRLLIVQDSYAHCLIPFALHDFSKVDFLDLRYYNESLKSYMEQGDYTDILFLYNAAGFAEDTSLAKLLN